VTRILREADVERVLDMDAIINAVEASMRELGEGKAQNEPRRRAFAPGSLVNVMFGSFPGGNCMGSKQYSVASGTARFLVTVFGLDGSLQGLIEAKLMGAYRTGAASAVAARWLAPHGRLTVALIGSGPQAATQALALSRVLEIAQLRVFSRNQQHREAFAADRAAVLGINVIATPTAEAAVRGADVVVTMTNSPTPTFEAGWVGSPALVIGAGSNFPNRAEVPAELVARAQTIVVDQLATARLESGDLILANAAGKFEWERATELATVVSAGWKPPDPPGITLFESHGMALWDLAAASVVLPAAAGRGLGEEIAIF
jgi:alanine dehydrogenase